MTNNDVFRRLRYAIDLSNQAVVEICRLAGEELTQPEVLALLKKEDEEGFMPLSDRLLERFLDGLIVHKRGPREGEPAPAPKGAIPLTNNEILKKIRVALALKDEDLLAVFRLAPFPVTKSELTALFRATGHEKYKECGDQLLRNFLKGLTVKYRNDAGRK